MKPVLGQKWAVDAAFDDDCVEPWYVVIRDAKARTILELSGIGYERIDYNKALETAQHIVDLHNASLEVCEWELEKDSGLGDYFYSSCGHDGCFPASLHRKTECLGCNKPIKVVSDE